jgi:hypothetical protein
MKTKKKKPYQYRPALMLRLTIEERAAFDRLMLASQCVTISELVRAAFFGDVNVLVAARSRVSEVS